MNNSHLSLKFLIAEVSDNDSEFQQELTSAICTGLKELKDQYTFGTNSKNEEAIKRIRHKSKPTLIMFKFNEIISELDRGKEILESIGFDPSFNARLDFLLIKVDKALQDIQDLG
jgi:hypothetical protein